MAFSRCNNCGKHIPARHAYKSGLCRDCYRQGKYRKPTFRGGDNMGFRPANHTPKTINERPTFGGFVSGRNNAIFIKNEYQLELDNTFKAIVDTVHYIQTKNKELKEVYSKIPSVKYNIEAHQIEKAGLYTNLGNVLKKETDFEEKMWKTTQQGKKVKSITVKNKFKDSDVDEMRFDSMMDYFQKYPEYASKSTFRKILEKIDEKEREIRKETEHYNNLVSNYNFQLSEFEIYIQKAEDKLAAYEKIKEDGEKRLADCRYNKGLVSKFRSEQDKSDTNLNLLSHRFDAFKHTLDLIKSAHSEGPRTKFKEIGY